MNEGAFHRNGMLTKEVSVHFVFGGPCVFVFDLEILWHASVRFIFLFSVSLTGSNAAYLFDSMVKDFW